MTTTIYVSRDAAALAVGADAVAASIAAQARERGVEVQLVRNGSRGLFWLEPLVEVQTDAGRIAYGPVQAEDVPALLDAGLLQGAAHALCLGPTEEIPELKRQQRLSFARCGHGDPLAPRALGRAAEGARDDGLTAIVQQVLDSGLRGRGGAAFPAGIKWRTVAQTPARRRSTSSAMPTKATPAPSPTAC